MRKFDSAMDFVYALPFMRDEDVVFGWKVKYNRTTGEYSAPYTECLNLSDSLMVRGLANCFSEPEMESFEFRVFSDRILKLFRTYKSRLTPLGYSYPEYVWKYSGLPYERTAAEKMLATVSPGQNFEESVIVCESVLVVD